MPVYRSTDSGAPVLTGQVGTVKALLQACLVDGYGTKPSAGWTMPFSGPTPANQAVFRQGGAGVAMFLQVDDNAPNASVGARQARVWGFEGMSAYGVGNNVAGPTVGSFPPYTTTTLYQAFRKSTTADATARQWILAADAKTMYLFVKTGDQTVYWMPQMFGSFVSYISSDSYKAALFGFDDLTYSAIRPPLTDPYLFGANSPSQVGWGWIPRGYVGTASAKKTNLIGNGSMANQYIGYQGAPGYNYWPTQLATPNADGSVYISRYRILEETDRAYNQGGHTLRGHLRGLYAWWGHPAYYLDGDTFGGVGALVGKQFLLLQTNLSAIGGVVCHALEITDTWES